MYLLERKKEVHLKGESCELSVILRTCFSLEVTLALIWGRSKGCSTEFKTPKNTKNRTAHAILKEIIKQKFSEVFQYNYTSSVIIRRYAREINKYILPQAQTFQSGAADVDSNVLIIVWCQDITL